MTYERAAENSGREQSRSTDEDYERILSQFGATKRATAECVNHLLSLGFSRGQARSAVYRFRQRHGLIRERGTDDT